eukprot:GHVL01005641.1.p1 GENE.GHVL01005641.1~~GHVL01005641.1.p1  ORF type:complete len:295 (+),score=73.19 GHVL01005641.1:129-1013(+)
MNVKRNILGFEQRSEYRHPDSCDEEICEVDATGVACPSAQMFSFLLLGDQDAGKSTFLHTFCNADNPNFTQLSSFFPIFLSKFINIFFSNTPPLGTPFIKTDIARGISLITTENFLFFLEEFNIKYINIHKKYVIIDLCEMGGDHIDRLMKRFSDSKIEYINNLDSKIEDSKIEDSSNLDSTIEDSNDLDSKIDNSNHLNSKIEVSKIEDSKIEDSKIKYSKNLDSKIEECLNKSMMTLVSCKVLIYYINIHHLFNDLKNNLKILIGRFKFINKKTKSDIFILCCRLPKESSTL